jgi:RNA polymerase sigma factor (TIGR02999 family)
MQSDKMQNGHDLLPLVYAELRRLAAHRMAQERPGQTLQATALVHEAWLRLGRHSSHSWENREHFFAAAAEAMRRILIENARRKKAYRHGGDRERVELDGLEIGTSLPDDQLLALDDAMERFATVDPVKARLVRLKFYGGLTLEEAGKVLGVSEPTAKRYWAYARAWLHREISGIDSSPATR